MSERMVILLETSSNKKFRPLQVSFVTLNQVLFFLNKWFSILYIIFHLHVHISEVNPVCNLGDVAELASVLKVLFYKGNSR